MKLSIIIPTLNEAESLPVLLSQLFKTPLPFPSPLMGEGGGGGEVIVADGGSTDQTLEAARQFGVRAIAGPAGRAVQMNAGAVAASGELLWFLHADSKLPPDWKDQLCRAASDPAVVGGGFRVAIDAPGSGYRFLDAWGAFRSWLTRTFFGDQGIFVRREIFERLGGFSESAPLEDLDFSARLREIGKVILLPGPLRTSARRWQQHGWWRTVFHHSRLVLNYSVSHTDLIPIVILAKLPVPGEVKTRLVPPLTQEEAAALALKLLRETVTLARSIEGVQPIVAVWPPGGLGPMRRLLAVPLRLIPQTNGDFGERLAQIFKGLHEEGARGMIILGADHPNLPADYLKQAVKTLRSGRDQVVLGPTEDGGYYLIGLNRPHPELFDGIPWSSSSVLTATQERAQAFGLPVKLLPPWYDIDRPEDLSR